MNLGNFAPHRYCIGNYGPLLWLMVLGDILIFLAYMSLSFSLIFFEKKRGKAPFGYIFKYFSHFIFVCGLTHLVDIIVLWWSIYWISSAVRIWCAIISIIAACIVWCMMPIAIKVNEIIWSSKDEGRLAHLQQMISDFESIFKRMVKKK